ncbi:MAG TPA: S8 family serine peptidase [Frankiaceae bacterium]|nr:S8 family serine peptidase [Frankiaceae bacterium]
MRKRAIPAVVTAVVLSGLAVPALAASAAEPPAGRGSLRTARDGYRPTGRLQVRFKDGVGATRRAAALARVADRGHRVGVVRRVAALDAAVLDVSDPRAARAALRNDPDVLYVEPEARYTPAAEGDAPELAEVGVASVQAEPSPNLGAGSVIAILDSPVSNTISDLNGTGKVEYAPFSTTDFEDTDDGWQDLPCDAYNCPHGTAVASAAAAESGDGGMVGVAPGATIRSYDVFRHWVYNRDGDEFHEISATSGDIAAALVSVADHAATRPELVAVNMSLEGPYDTLLIRDAIAYLHATAPRVTVVVAAGNNASERATFPAGDPYVLSVGATGQVSGSNCNATPNPTWSVASFSNRGKVDVVAPGHCVDVWEPGTDPDTGGSTGAVTVRKSSGTSYAAPMVAGIAALLHTADSDSVGDVARAAIIASATGGIHVARGAGKANAEAALALAGGTAPYTAMTTDRGGQVASSVGRRKVEVLRVDPTGATPTAPVPTVSGTYGTVSAGTVSAAPGIARRYATYAAARATGSFSLTATGGSGGDDTIAVPMAMLDAADNYEGLPAANLEQASVPLTYGTRSAYVRSAAIGNGMTLAWDFTYGEGTSNPSRVASDLFVWEPATSGGTADAATEPVMAMQSPTASNSGSVVANLDPCEFPTNNVDEPRPCRAGRYLVGFQTFSPADSSSSTSRYKLRLRYAGPTASLSTPAVTSSQSTGMPFTVRWSGLRVQTYDVSYAVKTKVGSTWKVTAWIPWKKTAGSGAVFGAGGSPVTLVQGRTYHFRLQSFDARGNPSLVTVKSTQVPYDDRSASIAFSPSWSRVVVADRWLGTATKGSTAGGRASLTTDASAFSIIGDKCAACGQFKVYVDGVYKKTVDTYRSSTATRQVLWSSGSLGSVKSHRVTVIVSGTAGRPKVVVDGIAALR